jgi:hypothetical protein
MLTRIPFALFATALACSVFAAPAHALRARVYVSKAGADVGACSFSAPCQSLGYALSAVEPDGEITILDSGGYNPITITQGVTITVPPGVEAGIAALMNGTAITINAPGATVTLRGLTLEGTNTANFGVSFTAGSRIEIIDCVISGFQSTGISVQPATAASVMIANTIVKDINPTANGTGIALLPQGSGAMTAALDQVTVSNTSFGLNLSSQLGPAPLEILITNSHIDNSSQNAIYAEGGSGTNYAHMILKNVTVNQSPNAIALNGSSTIWLSQVTQTTLASSNSIVYFNSGNSSYSDGTNHLMGALGGGVTLNSWAAN